MRRVACTLALALCVLGCSARAGAAPTGALPSSLGDQVPLITVEASDGNCMLSYSVIDVVGDPTLGTVNKDGGKPLTWPRGYTARSAGLEVEVLDPEGNVVLKTGSRYRISPIFNADGEAVAVCAPQPCPDCKLGDGPL